MHYRKVKINGKIYLTAHKKKIRNKPLRRYISRVKADTREITKEIDDYFDSVERRTRNVARV